MDMMSYLMGRNSGGGGKGAKIEVVTELPETGEANVIYLVPKETEDENNVFDEYLYINDEWELIGSTAIDISGKQDTMQFSTMPTASADYLGKIVQYTGATNANYTNGYFYVCVSETENDVTTYSWSNIEVQEGTSDTAYIQREEWNHIGGVSNQGVTISDDETKRIFTKFINNIYSSDGSKCGMLELYQNYGSSSSSATSYKLTTGYVKLLNKPTNISIYPEILTFENSFKSGDTRESLSYKKYALVIYGTWENDIFTCIKVWMSIYGITVSAITSNNIDSYVLRKTNTDTYNPSSNYNPSTKLYSDKTVLTQSGLLPYTTTTTYQEGDYVYRSATDLTIYKCNTADTTGTWDSSKWDQKTYMEYLSDTLVGGALNGSY